MVSTEHVNQEVKHKMPLYKTTYTHYSVVMECQFKILCWVLTMLMVTSSVMVQSACYSCFAI